MAAELHLHLLSRYGVTSLTFQGHVTSSITWLFDTPYPRPFHIGGPLEPSLCLPVSESLTYSMANVPQWLIYSVSQKNPPCGFLKFFPKRLGILKQFPKTLSFLH